MIQIYEKALIARNKYGEAYFKIHETGWVHEEDYLCGYNSNDIHVKTEIDISDLINIQAAK